jgi:hypothetical protein
LRRATEIHFGRRIDPDHPASRTDANASFSRYGAGAAAYLEDGLTRSEIGEVKGPLPHDSGAPECEQRDHEVVAGRPTNEVTVCRRVRLACVGMTANGGHARSTAIQLRLLRFAQSTARAVIHVIARYHVRKFVRLGRGRRSRRRRRARLAPGESPGLRLADLSRPAAI